MVKKSTEREPGKVCTISKYVNLVDGDDIDGTLYSAIDNLCLLHALTPGHNPGATFLYPEDPAYKKEIIELAYSKSVEDGVQAEKMIKALILPDVFASASDFKDKTVGSRLGIALVVKDATSKGKVEAVTFDNGAEIVLDRGFVSTKPNLFVWRVKKGRIPMEGPEYKPPFVKKRGKITGGSDRPMYSGIRRSLATHAEDQFIAHIRANNEMGNGEFVIKIVSFLNFLKVQAATNKQAADLLSDIIVLMDYNPIVSFYLIFEPYKTNTTDGAYFVPDEILAAWNGITLCSQPVKEYENFMARGCITRPSSLSEGADQTSIRSQIDTIRHSIDSSQSNSKLGLPNKVIEAYKSVMANNSISGLDNVFSASLLARIGASKKLWMDEFRYLIHAYAATVLFKQYQSATERAADAQNMLDLIRTYPGNRYASESKMTNVDAINIDVAPTSTFYELKTFILSTDFLYVSPTPDFVGEPMGKPYDPTSHELCNMNYSKRRALMYYADIDTICAVNVAAARAYYSMAPMDGQHSGYGKSADYTPADSRQPEGLESNIGEVA